MFLATSITQSILLVVGILLVVSLLLILVLLFVKEKLSPSSIIWRSHRNIKLIIRHQAFLLGCEVHYILYLLFREGSFGLCSRQ